MAAEGGSQPCGMRELQYRSRDNRIDGFARHFFSPPEPGECGTSRLSATPPGRVGSRMYIAGSHLTCYPAELTLLSPLTPPGRLNMRS